MTIEEICKKMGELGWSCELLFTQRGWGGVKTGFSVWISRWNWHRKPIDKICFQRHTDDLSQLEKVISEVAEEALTAYEDEYYPFKVRP